jgi:hypothetical protein
VFGKPVTATAATVCSRTRYRSEQIDSTLRTSGGVDSLARPTNRHAVCKRVCSVELQCIHWFCKHVLPTVTIKQPCTVHYVDCAGIAAGITTAAAVVATLAAPEQRTRQHA